jgi:hypothetical protein
MTLLVLHFITQSFWSNAIGYLEWKRTLSG